MVSITALSCTQRIVVKNYIYIYIYPIVPPINKPHGHHEKIFQASVKERMKTVLSCLFDALGQSRATTEVARVLCTLCARTAAASTAAAAGEGAPWPGSAGIEGASGARRGTLAPAAAPKALLPMLESLPHRSTEVLGLAVEMLEIGQAAADALVAIGSETEGGGGGERGAGIFESVDAAGRCARVS